MKRLLMALAALASLTAPASAAGFGIFASGWDSDATADEFLGGGVAVSFPVGQLLDVDLRATYYEEGDLSDFGEGQGVFPDRNLRVVPVEAGVKVNFMRDAFVSPYIGGGASYFILDHDVDRFDLDDELGFYVNGGATFGQLGGADFFAEAIYRSAEATFVGQERGDGELEDRVDFDLDGVALNVGLMFTYP